MDDDLLWEGNLVIKEGVMDLNGHSMHVTGDLIQYGGDLYLNGGSLEVDGKYALCDMNVNSDYPLTTGRLVMMNDDDKVLIHGNLIFQPNGSSAEDICAGTLELQGSIINGASYGLEAGGNNTIVFSGTEVQRWTTEKSGNSYGFITGKAANLINRNTYGILLDNLEVAGKIQDETGTVNKSGQISVKSPDQILSGYFSGPLTITEECFLQNDLTIGGCLAFSQAVHFDKYSVTAAEISASGEMYLECGQVNCKGRLWLGKELSMTEPEGYLFVGGEFNLNSYITGTAGGLQEGTLEVQGNINLSFYKDAHAGENHTLILSGVSEVNGNIITQKMNIYGNNQQPVLGKLILKKPEKCFSFSQSPYEIAREVIYDITDITAPEPITYINLLKATETSLYFSYGGANDESGIAGYRIYRNGKKIASTIETTYRDVNLAVGTEYTYRIYPYDIFGNTAEEAMDRRMSTRPDVEPPTMPSGNTITTRTGSSISLRWNRSTDNIAVAGYSLYRNDMLLVTGLKQCEYKDSAVESGKSYRYYVKAYDTSDNLSEASSIAESAVAAPDILSVTPESESSIWGNSVQLAVHFRNVGNSTGNTVTIDYQNSDGVWEKITDIPLDQQKYSTSELRAEMKWDISGLTGSNSYKVRYTVTDADGNVDTEEAVYIIDREAPQLPEVIRVLGNDGTARISWKASSSLDCSYYELYRKEAGQDKYSLLTRLNGRFELDYTDRTVEMGKTYLYALKTGDNHQNISELSEENEVTIENDTTAPYIKSMEPDTGMICGKVLLSVNAYDNRKLFGIRLEYKAENEEEWKILTDTVITGSSTTYVWNTVELQDGVYVVRAIAVDACGNESTREYNRRYTIDNTGTEKVVIVDSKNDATGVWFCWNDVKDKDLAYYLVERKSGETFIRENTVYGKLYYQATGLKPCNDYCYRVVGYDNMGNRGIPSDEITITTIEDTTAPVITSVAPSNLYCRDELELNMNVRDNYSLKEAVFSYSRDNENYTEITRVEASGEKEETFSYLLDLGSMEEGNLYVRFEAYDAVGNRNGLTATGKEVIAKYIIDRTAPEQVTDVKARDNHGSALLEWTKGTEEDISFYRIYRADGDKEIYSVVSDNCRNLYYSDLGVKEGKTYLYRVAAVDNAGNEGQQSLFAYVAVTKDVTAPVIHSMTQTEGNRIGKKPEISIWATDNRSVKEIRLTYKAKQDIDLWNELETSGTAGENMIAKAVWNNDDLPEGEYVFRATAVDAGGNTSELFETQYILDLTAPGKPELTTVNGHYEVTLHMLPDSDVTGYTIMRKEVGAAGYQEIATCKENTYTDKSAKPDTVYYYQTIAYDSCGNASYSDEKEAVCDDLDVIAPVAIMPENMIGIAGMELAFDGMGSTDNIRIKEFKWEMGDGSVLYGAQPVYAYQNPGEYTVALTVTDGGGNCATAYTTVRIYELNGNGIADVRIRDEAGNGIPYATVFLKLGENDHMSLQADSNGLLTVVTKAGSCCVAAYSAGFLPSDREIMVSEYERKSYDLTLRKDELVVGELTAHRMSLQEMIAAGVDFSNPDNYSEFSYTLELVFAQTPMAGIIWIYPDADTSQKGSVSISGTKARDKNNGTPSVYVSQVKREHSEGGKIPGEEGTPGMPILAYITVGQSVSWLQDMFEVNLGILNAADTQYSIEDAEASLILPDDGLLLAALKRGQSLTQSMGTIKGQENKSVSWVVRGEKAGYFNLDAEFKGRLMPFDVEVGASFKTKDEIEVTDGSGIHIYLMPESVAYLDELYYVNYRIVNESSKTFYNFSLSGRAAGVSERDYRIKNPDTGEVTKKKSADYVVERPSEMHQPIMLGDKDSLDISTFRPGEVIEGTMVSAIGGEGDPEEVYYRLIEYTLKAMSERGGGVQVSVSPGGTHVIKETKIYVAYGCGDPVDVTTGYFTDSIVPLSVQGSQTLSIDLNYSSDLSGNRGELGYGWYHSYESRVEEVNGNINLYYSPENRITFLSKAAVEGEIIGTIAGNKVILATGTSAATGEYLCPVSSMKGYRMFKNNDGTYAVFLPDHSVMHYDSQGRLDMISDADGKRILLNYNGQTTVVTEEVSGVRLYLNYDSNRTLISVSDDSGRTAFLGYDEYGRMSGMTDPLGQSVYYSYDENNRIISASNAEGIYVSNQYDEENRVISQTDALGSVMNLTYQTDEWGQTTTTVTDGRGVIGTAVMDWKGRMIYSTGENGGSNEADYDSQGNLVYEKDAYGKSVYREYDSKGNMTGVIDTGNIKTELAYDANGNLLSMKQGDRKVSYTYNDRNQMVRCDDMAGKVTFYEYNDSGLLVKEITEGLGSICYSYTNGRKTGVTDYNGNQGTLEYDATGNLVKTVDALGNTTKYTYDALGQQTSVTDALGNTTTYTYDCNGRKLTETDCKGRVTVYTYDRMGNTTSITAPDGSVIRYEYDCYGNCIKITNADETTVSYTYDIAGNMTGETLSDGTRRTYTYDLMNRRTGETDAGGCTTTYSYYPNGNIQKVLYADGTYKLYNYNEQWKVSGVRERNGAVTSYTYDLSGNVTAIRDALGNSTSYTYDRYGRLLTQTDANGNKTSFAYDANGNCIRKTNSLGTVAQMRYDALNRMTEMSVTDKQGEVYSISYAYDALGRVISSTDEEGNTTAVTYDEYGNQIKTTDAMGNSSGISHYDSMGRLSAVTDVFGNESVCHYDGAGRLTAVADLVNGKETTRLAYIYDSLGRVVSVTDALEGVTKAAYNTTGSISTLTDANGGITSYTYDAFDRIICEENAIGSIQRYTYNAAGLLAQAENARGQKTEYTYDLLGRIISVKDELGTVSYRYDAVGNILETSDENGSILRSYDELNRVTQYTDYHGNTVKYGYDELGNLITLTYPGGEIVRYQYYKNGLLKNVIEPSGSVTAYTYDRSGNLLVTKRPNGTSEINTYDVGNRLVSRTERRGDEILSETSYVYDRQGNITSITNTVPDSGAAGIPSVTMTYDADNRLLTYNGENVVYDADGNMTYGPVDGSMTELVYDCRNRLIRAGETTYIYDAENNRTGSSDSTGSYEYITDTVSDTLSHVLVITSLDQEGKPVSEKQYIYGNNLILEKHNTFESESASEKQEVRTLYHHYNHLGSTVRLTDAQGETIRTYRYGTYGELLSENDGLTCFLYNGSHGVITEKNGLYYMRNRYYSPDIKRFINRDVVTGSMDNSQSLNRYSYVQGNPVSYIDPFGLSPQTVTDGSALVHAVLGFIGLFPVIGIAADVLDCVIYVSEGDYFMATLSMVSAVVDTFGAYKLLTIGDKLSKTAKATKATVQIISGAMNFKVNSARSMEIAADMWQKYHVEGAEKGADYKLDKLALGISLFSSVASALCAVKGAKELNNLSKLDDWTSGFKKWTNSYQGDGGSKTVETPINTGTSMPRDSATPNSIYEQINNDGTVKSRAFYDENGRQFSRQDFDHPHFDKKAKQYYQPHEHNYSYNEYGQRNGKSDGPLPDGYTNQSTK